MNTPIIEIKNIGKKYNITHQRGGYIALRDVIMNVLRAPFSFLKTKVKKAAGFETKEDFWALKDISFTVKKGEVVGIIGANGAGKSTLLKILSQITPPTEGEIKIRGRVGSLLEVGTGFHPELSGRENIFLNGAILGMAKHEIAEKFDEIVEFAGIEKFLDTPVKYYSSGMYVRLAFSVAAHMEPDVLIIDEVLAVGDAEFQKKCLGKMEDITANEGRTILFVSHNLEAVKKLCTRSFLLQNGKIIDSGPTEKVIEAYLHAPQVSNLEFASIKNRRKRTNGKVSFRKVKGIKNTKECWDFKVDEKIEFDFSCTVKEPVENLAFYMALLDQKTGDTVTNARTVIQDGKINPGKEIHFKITIPPKTLRPGQFGLYFAIGNSDRSEWYDVLDANVGLPPLQIREAYTDNNDNSGIFSIPFTVTTYEKNSKKGI